MRKPIFTRKGGASEGEILHFFERLAAEANSHLQLILSALRTIGLPDKKVKILETIIPIVMKPVAALEAATHDDTPGGVQITRSELKQIAARTAFDIEKALLEYYADIVVDDPEEEPPHGTDAEPLPSEPTS